jgi:hypothetical protein
VEDEDRIPFSEIFGGLETSLMWLRRINELRVGELDSAGRERLTRLMDAISEETRRVSSAFGRRCPYCRTAPAEMVGECAKCGVEACSDCATVHDGVILHRGACTAFWGTTEA